MATLTAADLHPCLSDPALEVMGFLNEITNRYPRAISFAPGRPYEGFFELGQVDRYLGRYLKHLREQGRSSADIVQELFQYGPSAGAATVREIVAGMLAADEGIAASPDDIVITDGCQEALILVLHALLPTPQDVLLVTDPCYAGVTGAALVLGRHLEPVVEGPDGVDPDVLRRTVQRLHDRGVQPRAMYVAPYASNPSGVTMSEKARRRLIETAAEAGILLLEDHAYGIFAPPGSPPALKALDADHTVIHLGTFAKSGFPGLRVGYAVADQPVSTANGTRPLAAALATVKSMVTVNTSPLAQAVASGMILEHGMSLRAANVPAAAFYRRNLNLLTEALHSGFQGRDTRISWNRPDGGFFLVVSVPFEADDDALRASAEHYGVLWTPMRHFHRGSEGDRQLRLSISYLSPDQVAEGARRLIRFIEED